MRPERRTTYGSLSEVYSAIARRHAARVDPLAHDIACLHEQALRAPDAVDAEALHAAAIASHLRLSEDAHIAVVFACMALEAFIYGYALSAYSDTYVERFLSRLDLRAKWVVIPELISGHAFPRDTHAYELLDRLVQMRNDLSHQKASSRMPEFLGGAVLIEARGTRDTLPLVEPPKVSRAGTTWAPARTRLLLLTTRSRHST